MLFVSVNILCFCSCHFSTMMFVHVNVLRSMFLQLLYDFYDICFSVCLPILVPVNVLLSSKMFLSINFLCKFFLSMFYNDGSCQFSTTLSQCSTAFVPVNVLRSLLSPVFCGELFRLMFNDVCFCRNTKRETFCANCNVIISKREKLNTFTE